MDAMALSIMTLSIMASSIMKLSIKGLLEALSIMTFSIAETQHNHPECRYAGCCILFIVRLSVIMLNVIMQSVVAPHYGFMGFLINQKVVATNCEKLLKF